MLRAPVGFRHGHQQHAAVAQRSPPLAARGHPHPCPKRHASAWGARAVTWSAELLPAMCLRQHRQHQHQKCKQQHGITLSALPERSLGLCVKFQWQRQPQQRQRHQLCRIMSSLAPLPASAAAGSLLALLPAAAVPATPLLPVSGPWGVWAVLVGAGAIGMWSERTRLGKELSGALVATLVGGRMPLQSRIIVSVQWRAQCS